MPSRGRPDGAAARHLAYAPHWTVSIVPNEGVLLRGDITTVLLEGELHERLTPLLVRGIREDEIVGRLSRRFEAADVWYALLRLERDGHITAADHPRGRRTPAILIRRHRGMRVAIVGDYLHPGLARLNRQALRDGSTWALAKPGGEFAWAGPRFVPGRTACWRCLADRLSVNRPVERFLSRRGISPSRRPASGAWSTHLLSRAAGARTIGVLWTRAPHATSWTKHIVERRPECPECGNAGESPRREADGPHSAITMADLEAIRRRASPLTGLVHSVTQVQSARQGMPVWIAPSSCPGRPASLAELRPLLELAPSGKGRTAAEARAGAIGEAIERRSGVFTGREARRRASFASLGNRAIHPNACMLFSQAQYRERATWNERQPRLAAVPRHFDEHLRLDWTPLSSLTKGVQRFLPTSYLYYDHPEGSLGMCPPDSSGCAAGRSFEDAARRGLLELVERDAVAIWWYNRLRRPGLPLSAAGPWARELARSHQSMRRTLWLLDLTTDLGIPVVGAVSRRIGHASEDIVFGFAAHTDPAAAAQRALGEMTQVLVAVVSAGAERGSLRPELRDWLRSARTARDPWLTPAPSARSTNRRDIELTGRASLRDLVARLGAHGLEVLVLDQTRPECRVPVARVVVPGLRPFWPRLAPGRLYGAPVAAGWTDRAKRERDMNPVAFFL